MRRCEVDLDARQPAHVELRSDRQAFGVAPSIPRAGLTAAFGDAALGNAGWRLRRHIGHHALEILSFAADGARDIVYVGVAFAAA